jgi:hypothetical protein
LSIFVSIFGPVWAVISGPRLYFAGARVDDDELRDVAAEDEQRQAQARARHDEATRSNLGPGHDIRAGLIDPTDVQFRALTEIVRRLLVRQYRELIAYGVGWTDPERQQPGGDTGRHEPRQLDAILDAELERALADPDRHPDRRVGPLARCLVAAHHHKNDPRVVLLSDGRT